MTTDRPKITSLRFDHGTWKLHEQGPQHRIWLFDEHGIVAIRFVHGKPSLYPLEFEPAYLAQDAECEQNHGVLLSFDLIELDSLPASCGVAKYRSPINPMAMLYVAQIAVPVRDFAYHLKIECAETGDVGARETAVMLLREKQGLPWPSVGGSRGATVLDEHDLASRAQMTMSEPAPLLPSDNEEYDEVLPQHPLSVLRRTLHRIRSTVSIDECVKHAAHRR